MTKKCCKFDSVYRWEELIVVVFYVLKGKHITNAKSNWCERCRLGKKWVKCTRNVIIYIKLIGQTVETADERERRLQHFKIWEQRGGEEGGSVRRKTTGAIYNQIVLKRGITFRYGIKRRYSFGKTRWYSFKSKCRDVISRPCFERLYL